MQTHEEIKNEQYFIWATFNTKYHDYLINAYSKVEGGIKYLVNRYRYYDWDMLKRDVNLYGYFSERPFKLGRGCDGSGDACCHALYYDFCLRHDLNPVVLFRQAYQKHDGKRYCDPDYKQMLEEANWQGIEHPQSWGVDEMQKLLHSLYAINNRSLVEVLKLTPPFTMQAIAF